MSHKDEVQIPFHFRSTSQPSPSILINPLRHILRTNSTLLPIKMAPSAIYEDPTGIIALDPKKVSEHPLANDRLWLSGQNGPIADWHKDLIRDGFVVVKGAVPKDRADKYADQMFSWLEDLCVIFWLLFYELLISL